MNTPMNDETLIAYLDAELDATGMDTVEQALETDPALRQRLQRLVMSGEQLRAAYAGVREEAVPPRLVQAILEAPAPAAKRQPRARSEPATAQTNWFSRWLGTGNGPWMPTALASVVALGLGLWLGLAQGPVADATLAAHRPVSDQALLVALEGLPSGRVVRTAGQEIELLASFRHRDGRVCREFNRSGLRDDPLDHLGLACREPGGDWTVAVLASDIRPAEAARGGYRTASDRQHEIIDQFRQQQSLGQPLELADEKAWMERGWGR